MKNFKGFTLAEVLITLGVIGVVAAMTMPTIIKQHQKQVTVNKLKKVYTILNQAIKLSEIDNSEYEYWEKASDIGANAYFEKYFKPYLKTAKLCKTYSECGYQSNTPWYFLSGTHDTTAVINGNTRVPFIMIDGIFVNIFVTSANQEFSNLYVDLNAGKIPNKYGKDVFIFKRDNKGRIQPFGYENSITRLNEVCSITSSGHYCAAKIIKDGWKISDDYPW